VSKNSKKEKLSEMILEYLRKHPDAGDTLEGITKWWLEFERISVSVDEVSSVLRNLERHGNITTYSSRSGAVFYKISHNSRSRPKSPKDDS
jgi:hypothetical protein